MVKALNLLYVSNAHQFSLSSTVTLLLRSSPISINQYQFSSHWAYSIFKEAVLMDVYFIYVT